MPRDLNEPLIDERASLSLFANADDPHRLQPTLLAIQKAMYTPLIELRATAWVTDEPVPFERRRSGRKITPRIGDRWGHLWDCAWFLFEGHVPSDVSGEHLVLLLDLSGEGCVVDEEGSPVCGLASHSAGFDPALGAASKRVVRWPQLGPASKVSVWVDAGCNDLFGAETGGGRLTEAHVAVEHEDIKALYYDYEVLLDLLQFVPPAGARHAQILRALRRACHQLSRYDEEEARGAREILHPELAKRGETPSLWVTATGHAHLDLAWLWPLRETTRKAARSFSTALRFMERYPDYVFGASQAYLYDTVKEVYPRLYEAVRQRVSEGRWDVQGATWVECDVNLPSGESLVRQILYGRKFFREEFGLDSETAWLPDDFGFPASLPQILLSSGIKYFMTTKLSWSLINRFPRHTFRWRGIDGSAVLAHMPPEGTYNSAALPHSVKSTEERFADKEVSQHALMVFGIGDGGGGPGEEHLERLERMTDLAGLSPVRQGTVRNFFHAIALEQDGFDTWDGELYLERHQGTYTSQGHTKRFNRKMEVGLHNLELLSTVAHVMAGLPYPVAEVERIWKEVLLYQFHDILPGSAINRVYKESAIRFERLMGEVHDLLQQAMSAVKGALTVSPGEAPCLLVFNTLPWPRSCWVQLDGKDVLACDVPSLGFASSRHGQCPHLLQA